MQRNAGKLIIILSVVFTLFISYCHSTDECGTLDFDAELNKEKQIQQPGYPEDYGNYLQCSYTFRSSPGTRIRFWFNNFGTQKCCSTSSYTIIRNPACCGYFQYYDVGSMIKNTIKLPKSDDTSRHYSNSTEMSLYMHLARDTIYSGFSLTYTAVEDCGTALNTSSHWKNITSPGFPNHHYSNQICTWTITAPYNHVINISTHFVNNETCCTRLQARESRTDLYQLSTGTHYLSRGTYLAIDFISEKSVMRKGFRLSYRAVHVCGVLHFDAELNKEKQIKQPEYPWDYPSYLQCSYTFRSPPGTRIRFWFNNFGTQKCCSTSSYTISRNPACCGYFQYYDVGSFVRNTIKLPKSDDTSRHYSNSSEMSLYLYLARNTIYSGFSLTYTAVEDCGTALNTSSHWKNITSPGFPNHHHSNQICTWTITAPYNHVINISAHFVNNETCCIRLQARESRTDLYQLSTGTHYLSRGTNLAIDFISEKSVMRKGFRLSYRAVHVCGVLHFDAELNKEKQIKQPGYPWDYPSYLQCSYTFRSPPGTRIRFWFNNFGTQKCCSTSSYAISRNPACCGYFQYYDVGSFIRNTINLPKSDDTSRHYSNSSEMSLYLYLARNTIYSGFSLTYTAVEECRTALNTSSHWKNITSPGFPNHHHSNQICTWTITAPYNHVINISTHFVNNETCCTRLQARESRTDLYQLSTGTHYLSRGTNLAIDFISEKSVMKKGFRLSYRAVHVCGALHFDAELNKEKQIKQPGYPWEYPSYLQCSYTFRSPPGTRIRFWFNNFGTQKCCSTSSYTIRRNPACCGYFQYYDVGSIVKNTINLPKSEDTSRHYSNSSEMSLYLHLARNTIYSGFSLTYTAVGDITPTSPITTTPPSKPPGNCYVKGDPHYRSFDGRNFNFQGPCSYTLVKTLSQAGNSFLVEAENEYRGSNTRVSYLKNVFFTLDQNSRIELAKGRILKINDTVVNLPYVNNKSGINIRFSGRMIVLVTSFGLKISYDGSSYLRVEIPGHLSGQIEGLCGNFNGNPNDDFMNRTSGDLIASISQFANQYRSSEMDCNFPIEPHDDDEDICSENERAKFGGLCSILNGSCFSHCHLHLDPVQYYEDCLFDACAFQDAIDSLGNNVGAYARECQDMNVTICDWRKLTDTPLFCPPHSHYSPCMSRCPATCVYHDTSSCDLSCVEGCDCDEGNLLSSDTCVKESECGCIHDGRYYKAKQSFYKDDDCTSKCTCRGGIVTCAMSLCGSGERCGLDDKGRRACIPLGRGICSAWTDPHYKTFDGRSFDFMGSCSYYMARTHRLSTSDTRWFSIEATNEHRGSNTRVSYLSYVTVHLYNNTVRLDKDDFEINGATVQGYDSDQFMVTSSGRFLMLTTEHDVRVSFQRNRLTVDIPSTYIGEVQGFCGSYNNNRADDFETVAGKLTNDVNNFSLSYQVGECPDPIPEPFLCSESDREKWGAADFCGVLVNRSGLFAQCHHLVDPNSYFQTCLTDLCATDGDQDIFTQALESYVAACHDNGLDLCDWRLKSGRENIVCPSRSRYVSCASPCSDICANPFASSNCPLKGFVEDCVCNVGYIRDGDYCIRKSECGNTVNGTYVSKVLKDLVPIKIRVNFTHTYHMMVSVSIKKRFRLFENKVVDVTHGIFLELSRHAYLIKLMSINAFIPQSGFKINIRVDFTWSYRVMLSSYVIERYRIRIHEINDVSLDIFSVIEQETSLFWLFEAGNEGTLTKKIDFLKYIFSGPPEGADVIIRVDYMWVYIGFLPSQVVSEYRFNLFDVNDVTREIYARILDNSLVTQLSQIEAFVRPSGITVTVRVNFSHMFRLHIPPQVIDDYIIKIDVINDVTEEMFVELGVLAYIVQLVSVPAPPTNQDFLPYCTVRQAVTWVLSCEHVFSRPQPCLGPVTCRYKLDELLRCVGSQIYRCKIGQGPNKLDSLNLSWFNSDAILAALSDVTMQSDHPPNMELITFCFHADSNLSYPHTIGRQFNQCDETILDDLVEKAKTFYYDFTMAQSRKEICSSLMGLKVWFVDSVKSRCTFDDFAGLSESAVNYLSNFVKIVVETLEIFNFSTCRDEMEANDWFSCKSDRP